MESDIEKLEATIRIGLLQFFEKFDALIDVERERNKLAQEHLDWERERQAKMDMAIEENKQDIMARLFGSQPATGSPEVVVPGNVSPRSPGDGPTRPPRHPRR